MKLPQVLSPSFFENKSGSSTTNVFLDMYRRIREANTLLSSGEIEEYHGNRGFGESEGDEEARTRLRKPVPNLL